MIHWGTAALLAWQFAMTIAWRVLGEHPALTAIGAWGPYHATVGVLVLALLAVRIGWAWRMRSRRPRLDNGMADRLARMMHAGLYVTMAILPLLGLAATYAYGDGYRLWGLQLLPATGRRDEALTATLGSVHQIVGWTLGVLLLGHIGAALHHRYVAGRHDRFRMAGPLGPAGARRSPRSMGLASSDEPA